MHALWLAAGPCRRRSGRRRPGRLGDAMCLLLVCECLSGSVLAASLFQPSGALANGLAVSESLTAGSFGGVLTGQRQVLIADEEHGGTPFGGFSITDSRGTGVGWYVTVSATRFANQTRPGEYLASNSLTMPRLKVDSIDSSSTVPDTLGTAATIDNGGAGVVVATCAERGQGMGTYRFTSADGAPWELVVRSEDYAGVYVATVTITVTTLAL